MSDEAHLNIAQKALKELFPEKDEQRILTIRYSRRFSSYNANVKYNNSEIGFSLSKEWEQVSPEIQQGLIERLLCKIYGVKKSSMRQDLYRSFMKYLTKYSRTDDQNEYIKGRFDIINDRYFYGMMSAPNLRWGQYAYTKLGHYEYASDTIVISRVFEDAKDNPKVEELLDFVLYHEMLHKKLQYDHKKERARHHTKEFREEEKKWHDKDIEKKLRWFLAKKKLRKAIWK